jgi:hypothetical protein
LGLSNVSFWLNSGYAFEAVILYLSQYIIKWHIVLFYDTKFDFFVKVAVVRFLHCEDTIFLFIISILWENTLRLCKHPIS